MNRRNWTDLSRKLVDRFDMLAVTGEFIQDAIGKEMLALVGEGILATRAHPIPGVVTLSGIALTGTVTALTAYDATGQRLEVPATQTFGITPDGAQPRKALLVARYAQVGDTPIPKPSNPIVTINLNLLDSFEVQLIHGVPGAVPVYPAKGANDVVLMGLLIPAAAANGAACTQDPTQREKAFTLANRLRSLPTVVTAAAYAVTENDSDIQADATAAAQILTLPPAVQSIGQRVRVKKTDATANTSTVAAGVGDNIDGVGTQVIDQQNTMLELYCVNATTWNLE